MRSLGWLRRQPPARLHPENVDEAGSQLAGGFPYSEGIFEDINKAIVAMYYWQGQGQPQDAILEYANYAFSSIYKGEVARAVQMLETANRRERHASRKPEWIRRMPRQSKRSSL